MLFLTFSQKQSNCRLMNLFLLQMAAAVRFICLLLFYGLLYIYHWWVIAVSIHLLLMCMQETYLQ
jgi:hypothetical protein